MRVGLRERERERLVPSFSSELPSSSPAKKWQFVHFSPENSSDCFSDHLLSTPKRLLAIARVTLDGWMKRKVGEKREKRDEWTSQVSEVMHRLNIVNHRASLISSHPPSLCSPTAFHLWVRTFLVQVIFGCGLPEARHFNSTLRPFFTT